MNWSDVELQMSSRDSKIRILESRIANIESSIISLIEELRERTVRMERDIYNLKEESEARRTLAQERSE